MKFTLFKIVLWIITILILIVYLVGIGIIVMFILSKIGVPDRYYEFKQFLVAIVAFLLSKFTYLPAIDIIGELLKKVFKMNQSKL